MDYRRLGRTGLKVSRVGLGSWLTIGTERVDAAEGKRLIDMALDHGVNLFDTADSYSNGRSEAALGELLSDVPREQVVLSSKVYFPTGTGPNDRGLSRKHIRESLDRSLRRLGTDYLDLYICHREDPETPLEETVSAMDDACRQGKVLYWGTSQWRPATIEAAYDVSIRSGLRPPTFEQSQFNLLAPERVREGLRPLANDRGLGIVGWSPLANGLLSGKYDGSIPHGTRLDRFSGMRAAMADARTATIVRGVATLARAEGLTSAQLALLWAVAEPSLCSVLIGASSQTQLEENLAVLNVLPRSDALIREVEALITSRDAEIVG